MDTAINGLIVIIVSDTSPITNLAAIGQLDLLRQLYSNVTIPQSVYHERATGAGKEMIPAVQRCISISNRS